MNWGWIRCHDLFSQIRSWRWYCNSVAVSCFLTFTVQPLLSLSRASFFFLNTHTHQKQKQALLCLSKWRTKRLFFKFLWMNVPMYAAIYFICKMRWLTSNKLVSAINLTDFMPMSHEAITVVGALSAVQLGFCFDLMPPRVVDWRCRRDDARWCFEILDITFLLLPLPSSRRSRQERAKRVIVTRPA